MTGWATLDRRTVLGLGTLGVGALAMPGAARAAFAQGFTHSVASGEPGPNSMLFWTRYVAAQPTRLRLEVAEDTNFARVVAGADATADPVRDHTARVEVDGLKPGRWYAYRFIAPDGTMSDTGRTRTLPAGSVDRFAMAVFSCSNLPFGWFNAYAHAAARDDLHLAVHLGDYIYEYPRGVYPSTNQSVAGRVLEPAGETIALADYRLRYAAYRADADLAALHRNLPMIAMWDDHEFANDTWRDGAQNHQPEEGDWAVRKAAAERAYHDWMPVSDSRWRRYDIGDLATLFRPETRITGRSQPFDIDPMVAAKDAQAQLKAFRKGAYHDPARHMLGAEQEKWLIDGFAQARKAGTKWQVLAQQVVMGTLFMPPEAANWVGPNPPDFARKRFAEAQAAAKAGLPLNLDAWDGYPVARARLLKGALDNDSNLVVLTGDTHNAWGFDLAHKKHRVGVEFAVQSVTSAGFESSTRAAEADRVKALMQRNPSLRFTNTHQRGYLTLNLTPDRAQSTWHFLDTIRSRSTALAGQVTRTVRHGQRRLDAA